MAIVDTALLGESGWTIAMRIKFGISLAQQSEYVLIAMATRLLLPHDVRAMALAELERRASL